MIFPSVQVLEGAYTHQMLPSSRSSLTTKTFLDGNHGASLYVTLFWWSKEWPRTEFTQTRSRWGTVLARSSSRRAPNSSLIMQRWQMVSLESSWLCAAPHAEINALVAGWVCSKFVCKLLAQGKQPPLATRGKVLRGSTATQAVPRLVLL